MGDNAVGDGVLQPPFFDGGDKHRALAAGDTHLRGKGVDGHFVGFAADGAPCADDADMAVARRRDGSLRPGGDDARDRDVEALVQLWDGKGRSGVAGHDDHLRLLRQQHGADLSRVTLDGGAALSPVRDAGRIADVKDVFLREELAERGCDGQPADA